MAPTVYLIPTVLAAESTACIPAYVLDALRQCQVFFVENQRSARRYFKSIWKEMQIDSYQWHDIKELDEATAHQFRLCLQEGRNIGIVSEAGCPGVADPGQELVAIAQLMQARVKPLVGPSSILLALMASGMNGQQFRFLGYLPIDAGERSKAIRALESESRQKNCTQIFIETPYRNNQVMETLVKTCQPKTRICVAVDLTAATETIHTRSAQQWKESLPQLHKRPAIFLVHAGE